MPMTMMAARKTTKAETPRTEVAAHVPTRTLPAVAPTRRPSVTSRGVRSYDAAYRSHLMGTVWPSLRPREFGEVWFAAWPERVQSYPLLEQRRDRLAIRNPPSVPQSESATATSPSLSSPSNATLLAAPTNTRPSGGRRARYRLTVNPGIASKFHDDPDIVDGGISCYVVEGQQHA